MAGSVGLWSGVHWFVQGVQGCRFQRWKGFELKFSFQHMRSRWVCRVRDFVKTLGTDNFFQSIVELAVSRHIFQLLNLDRFSKFFRNRRSLSALDAFFQGLAGTTWLRQFTKQNK